MCPPRDGEACWHATPSVKKAGRQAGRPVFSPPWSLAVVGRLWMKKIMKMGEQRASGHASTDPRALVVG